MRILFSPLFFLISVFFNFGNPNLAPVHSQFLEDQKVLLHKMKDNFKFDSSLSTKLVSGQCLDDQRSLLIQFKNSIIFPPTFSGKLATWNRSEDCCTWKGIACDSSGHVISLELDNELIYGGIQNSTSLLGFQYLEKLNLVYNVFNRIQIPKGIYNLTNLTYLNLSNAGFVGQIPFEVSRMTRLVTLDLSTNFPEIYPLKLENPNLKMLVQNLKDLRELYLDGVNISAPGSEWCQALSSSLRSLSNLSLSNCLLSGPLDSSLSQLQNLSFLRLDENNLSTPIPDSFANFSKLTNLSMRNCSLQGFFPDKIFQLPTLQNLDLWYNNLLDGNLPQFPRGGSLRKIILSDTNFSGSLPDSIGNLGQLSEIDLKGCSFSGLLPSTITNLTEVVILDFSWNKLTGLLPRFNMAKKLTHIDLSHNRLTGSLSSMHFEGLNDLLYIDLSYNSLNGSIPPALFALPSLQVLRLSNNQFGGQVNEPSSTSSSQLDTLYLSSNLLEGPIPNFFFEFRKLQYLSLSSNFFNGTVHMENIRNLQNLTTLDLGHNPLSINLNISSSSSYPFPQLTSLSLASCNLKSFPDLRNQSKMTFLDLSKNQITGEIPNWIWEVNNEFFGYLNLSYNFLQDLQKPYNISRLIVVDIHNNQLQGDLPIPPSSAVYIDYSSNNFNHYIPAHIGNSLSFASFFSLSNNSLMGAIPESICNSSDLQVLDLSNNSLSGTIPKCLLSSQTLSVLNLGRNNLSGTIPDAFSPSCGLRTLDLRRNSLTGKIPGSLANCKSLEVLNVGNNKVEGIFPCMLKNSPSLRVLVLRSNIFQGELQCPGANNSWPNLQIIDIASNNFSGYLSPRFFLGWRGLMLDNDVLLQDNLLRFNVMNLTYYQDTVTVTMKGLEVELVKILSIFTAIDFSSNNFRGEIPYTVGDLSSLYILNLSHNALIGQIPKSIGKLTQLESLDLSKNQLTGEIPKELTSLTFLSFLNLSYNKLIGSIPPGRQFQTYSSASFEGNTGLCGFPLHTSCQENTSTPKSRLISTSLDFDWQFIFTGLGFGFGAALIIAPLAFVKKWRKQCNEHLEKLIKLIFPRYGFSYVRFNGKAEAAAKIVKETTEDEEDNEDEDNDEDEIEDDTFCGTYCVFCTKVDIQWKKAVHNPKCTCHYSPPTLYSSPTSFTSSSSLLISYRQNVLSPS